MRPLRYTAALSSHNAADKVGHCGMQSIFGIFIHYGHSVTPFPAWSESLRSFYAYRWSSVASAAWDCISTITWLAGWVIYKSGKLVQSTAWQVCELLLISSRSASTGYRWNVSEGSCTVQLESTRFAAPSVCSMTLSPRARNAPG